MRLTTRGELVAALLALALVCWLWMVGFHWYVEALLWAYSHWS